jgi:MraZ protein
MPFTGSNEHNIDDKNRLSIPRNLRKQHDVERDGKRFYVVPGVEPGTLRLFPEFEFIRWTERLRKGVAVPKAQRDLQRTLFTLAELVDMDSAGRIVLPAMHLKMSGIGREVAVNGVHDHIEIVDRAKFQERFSAMWNGFAELEDRFSRADSDGAQLDSSGQ